MPGSTVTSLQVLVIHNADAQLPLSQNRTCSLAQNMCLACCMRCGQEGLARNEGMRHQGTCTCCRPSVAVVCYYQVSPQFRKFFHVAAAST